MTDLPPQTDWYGHATLAAAVAAGFASVFRRGPSMHKVRNEINVAVAPIHTKVAELDKQVAVQAAQWEEVERRLNSIDGKLDRALER